MNWKMFIASHWKVGLLLLQIGLLMLMFTMSKALGDVIDSPVAP